MMSQKINVVEMPRASLLSDGTVVELEFRGADQSTTTLCFTPETLELWAARAVELISHAKNQKLAIGDHRAVHASGVVAATAAAPVGGNKVILSIRGNNGIPVHYALDPEQSEQLRPELRKAEASARAQKTQTRQ
jgi:hypothetical protein